jgi:hypothetical protein
MLKRSRATLATMLFVLGFAILISALTSSPSFQDCYATTNKDEAKREQQSTVLIIVYGPWHVLRCEAVSLNENNGAVTAVATLGIAAFTLILWLATNRQALLTAQIIALTREEFLASHRPLLIVHSIRILESDHSKRPDDQPLRVQFGVINAGTSAGTVTGSAVYLHVLYRIDRPYLLELVPNNIIPPRRFDVGAADNRVEVAFDRDGYGTFVNNPDKTPYLSGYIVYEDGRGHARTTFFCRQFERFPESNIDGRFVPVDDPDCERTY